MFSNRNSFTLQACREPSGQNAHIIFRRFRDILRMPLDSDSLGTLRIDRSAPAAGGSGGRRLFYIAGAVLLAALVGGGLWWWLGGNTVEVNTVTAEADS